MWLMNQCRCCFFVLRWIWPISLRSYVVPQQMAIVICRESLPFFWHVCRFRAKELISCACGAVLERLACCTNKIKIKSIRVVTVCLLDFKGSVAHQTKREGTMAHGHSCVCSFWPINTWSTKAWPIKTRLWFFYAFSLMSLMDLWRGQNIYKNVSTT